MTVYLPVFVTAVVVGLGCGTCCGSVVSVFLSSYVISHGNGVKTGISAFANFFFGKILSVTVLCTAASLVGNCFIDADGYIGSFNLRLMVRLVMGGIGLIMVVRWGIEERKQRSGCQNCNSCGGKADELSFGVWPAFVAGMVYGFTPCAPLLLVMGCAFTLSAPLAGLTGAIFSVASAVSPVLFLAVLCGALSGRMAREIPKYVKWFRLASYVLLIVMPLSIRAQV